MAGGKPHGSNPRDRHERDGRHRTLAHAAKLEARQERRAGEPFELPADHVHVGDVRVALIETPEGKGAVLLEVGSATCVLLADDAMALRDALLDAAKDVYVMPEHRRGHTH